MSQTCIMWEMRFVGLHSSSFMGDDVFILTEMRRDQFYGG